MEMHSGNPNSTTFRQRFRAILEEQMTSLSTSWFAPLGPKRSLACWVDFLVCPRRYLAVLPSHARANLFAGD
jgi:hypothetical protein